MREFCLKNVSQDRADDLGADARLRMFFVLREAIKSRRGVCTFTDKELAEAVGKHPSYVSRLLSGTHDRGITVESLATFLDALNVKLEINGVPRETLSTPKKVHVAIRHSAGFQAVQLKTAIGPEQPKRAAAKSEQFRAKVVERELVS